MAASGPLRVVPGSRCPGVANELLDGGHAWADGEGPLCTLEIDDAKDVGFYARRGYGVVQATREWRPQGVLGAREQRSGDPLAWYAEAGRAAS